MALTKPTHQPDTRLIPAEGDKDLGIKIFGILDKVFKDKQKLGLPARMKRNTELVKNKFWKSTSKEVPLTSANLIYVHVRQVVNQLTDNNPTFEITPLGLTDDEQEKAYDKLRNTADFWWRNTEQQALYRKSVWSGEVNGTAIEKVVFNPELEMGIGEVETVMVDPFHFGVFPLDCTDLQKAEVILHFRPYTVREVKRMWGDKAAEVQADNALIKELGDDRRDIIGGSPDPNRGYYGSVGSTVKHILNSAGDGEELDEQVLVVEAWVRDRSVVSEERVVESTTTESGEIEVVVEKTTRPRYRGEIRRIITCNLGKVVLEDRDNPSINPELPEEMARKTYLYDKFPFSVGQSVENPFSIWGDDDIMQLSPLLTEINKTLSQLTYFKDKSVRSKFINPQDSGIRNNELTNTSGVLNPTNSITAQGLRWVEPPAMQMDLVQYLDIYKGLFFLISGSFDVNQADFPGQDVIAYKAIAALLENAAKRNSHKEAVYTKIARERGRMFLSHCMNWYTEERYITVDDGRGKEQPMAIRGVDMIVPAKLTVVSGSTMPVSQVQRREEARELYKMNGLDIKELLDAHDWPNTDDVVIRMQAGPLGEVFEKLGKVGVPEPVLQYLQQIAGSKPQDIERAAKNGELPDFMSVVQQAAGAQPQGQSEGEQLESRKIMSDVTKSDAEAQLKTVEAQSITVETQLKALEAQARIGLIREQAETERFNRGVRAEGVKMDWKKLEQEAARLVADIEAKKTQHAHDAARIVTDIETKSRATDTKDREVDFRHEEAMSISKQGPYRESGRKSNNEEQD